MTTTKRPLEIDDRVRVYGRPGPDGGPWAGRVTAKHLRQNWGIAIGVTSEFDNVEYAVHPKQCRRLVKKPRRTCTLGYSYAGGWEIIDSPSSDGTNDGEEIKFVEARRKK